MYDFDAIDSTLSISIASVDGSKLVKSVRLITNVSGNRHCLSIVSWLICVDPTAWELQKYGR